MTLQELFDELLVNRSVRLHMTKQQSESLRVQLCRKWAQYKKMMDDCGFLSDELEACSIGRKAPATDDDPFEFILAPKRATQVSYQILPNKEKE